ncbi:MAG: phospholipase C, phosphocholine-specific [Niabella sp.]
MDNRREFIKKAMLLSGAAGISAAIPDSIKAALAIDPRPGSTFLDAEHVVILMQENRSFDHSFGTLQGVRGFNDPRAISLPNGNPVWFQTDEKGDTYAPFRLDIKNTKITWMGSLLHSRSSQVDANNLGKYDRWLTAKKSGNKKYATMPLTLGHYTREDLPFYFAMADAFTVCDQHFCSAMTSTTPNRSFFWTANIKSKENGIDKVNIRNTDFAHAKFQWETFPELLSKNDIKWKFYQNEITCGGGFKGEERSWLANFGCNLLEFFAVYNVKFAPQYIRGLQKLADTLPGEIERLQEASPGEVDADKTKAAIRNKQKALDNAREELLKWNKKNFDRLPEEERQLFYNAFTTNTGDPDYRKLAGLKYSDGGKERELAVPAGDIFYQFRKDVTEGKLPTVSWLAGPQNFSDHPSAPWYGAWYVSEILDILTKNPEVWQKTIFVITYDENDGYFDHVPPYAISDNKVPGSGKCAPEMDTEIEQVRLENELLQGIPEHEAREGVVGLGFRVPMIIASPWSRGGKVCSQLFEHTSTLQFLETFCSKKFNKHIRFENINPWRRAISGDLTAAFSVFNKREDKKLNFLNRNEFIETIYNAKFTGEPTGFKKVNEQDLKHNRFAQWLPKQEKGTRTSCALPYELFTNGKLDKDKKTFRVRFESAKGFFGENAAGAPFRVYAVGSHKALADDQQFELNRAWNYTVAAGHYLDDKWDLADFENEGYHLRVYAPNGFYREFEGDKNDPDVAITCGYQKQGNVILLLKNTGNAACTIEINDNAYGNAVVKQSLPAGNADKQVILNLGKSSGWYDFTVRINGAERFSQRFAGHVETGADSITDPAMGQPA